MPAPAVDAATVRKIASLARLTVPDGELPVLAEQLSRIVAYVDQLSEIPEPAFVSEPALPATPVRPDAARAGQGLDALKANAPRQLHGYGVVPRVVGGEP